MAHCPFEQLDDISPVLAYIRKLPSIKENKPGIFYLASMSFLHFHLKAGRRWADARDGATWGAEIDLPFRPSAKEKEAFLREVARRHKAVLSEKKPKRD